MYFIFIIFIIFYQYYSHYIYDFLEISNRSLINEWNIYSKEIDDLKNSLNQKETTINNQELKISNLQKNLVDLNKKIKQKEQELLNLKNIIIQKDHNSLNENEKISKDKISVRFICPGGLEYSIPCEISHTFAEIEEKLYKKFPKYRETNNYFLYKANKILRFKSIGQNKIENDMPITLCVP